MAQSLLSLAVVIWLMRLVFLGASTSESSNMLWGRAKAKLNLYWNQRFRDENLGTTEPLMNLFDANPLITLLPEVFTFKLLGKNNNIIHNLGDLVRSVVVE